MYDLDKIFHVSEEPILATLRLVLRTRNLRTTKNNRFFGLALREQPIVGSPFRSVSTPCLADCGVSMLLQLAAPAGVIGEGL